MKLTTAVLRKIIKEELDQIINEQDDSPKAVAGRLVAELPRPEKADKSKNPHSYHGYRLLKQLSLDGNVGAAQAYYNKIKSEDPTSATRMLPMFGNLQDLIKGARNE